MVSWLNHGHHPIRAGGSTASYAHKRQLLVPVAAKSSLLPLGESCPAERSRPWTEPAGTFSACSCSVQHLLCVAFPQLKRLQAWSGGALQPDASGETFTLFVMVTQFGYWQIKNTSNFDSQLSPTAAQKCQEQGLVHALISSHSPMNGDGQTPCPRSAVLWRSGPIQGHQQLIAGALCSG